MNFVILVSAKKTMKKNGEEKAADLSFYSFEIKGGKEDATIKIPNFEFEIKAREKKKYKEEMRSDLTCSSHNQNRTKLRFRSWFRRVFCFWTEGPLSILFSQKEPNVGPSGHCYIFCEKIILQQSGKITH